MPAARTFVALILAMLPPAALDARTVYRCVQEGSVSLATAPEPGADCTAHELDDADPRAPNVWGSLGVFSGALYEIDVDGRTLRTTRPLPGARKVLSFTARTPPGSPAHVGLGQVGRPRLGLFDAQFKAAARRTGVEDAWLRAIAHAESYFDPAAVSDKGALGVMQLMPEVAEEYGVVDPLDAAQSIDGGARHLAWLMRRLDGDLTRVAAAYNAGIGAVELYAGVPPYPETQAYVGKVHALHARYRAALGLAPLPGSEQPAVAAEPAQD